MQILFWLEKISLPAVRAEVTLLYGFWHLQSRMHRLSVTQLVCLRSGRNHFINTNSHAREKPLLVE